MDGDNIYLVPAPNSYRLITAYHHYNPADMSDGTTTIDWPESLKHILHRALDKHIALSNKDRIGSATADAELQRMLTEAAEAYAPSIAPMVKDPEGMGALSRPSTRRLFPRITDNAGS